MNDAENALLAALADLGYPVADSDLRMRLRQFLQSTRSSNTDRREPDHVLAWLEAQRSRCRMTVEEIPMSRVDRWRTDPETGVISHDSGEFFRVVGIRVADTGNREVTGWCQPILHQPESGILGLLVRDCEGVDQYLLQAKAEPGNIGKLQLSPTLQSTVSNLRKAHGGTKSPFADLFERPLPGSVLYSKYQGEDGGRLHLKKNLNMIVRILPETPPLSIPDNFLWVSMYAIKQLLKMENIVNISVRSIISVL